MSKTTVGLLKTILLGMLAALVFVQLFTLAQEYLLAFAAVRIDTAVLDFLSRKLLSLPMSYFNSRRTGDIQRRLEGARQVRQFAVQQGVGAVLAADLRGGRDHSNGDVQSVAHVRLFGNDASLRSA